MLKKHAHVSNVNLYSDFTVGVDGKNETSGQRNGVDSNSLIFHLSSASICLYGTGEIYCLMT